MKLLAPNFIDNNILHCKELVHYSVIVIIHLYVSCNYYSGGPNSKNGVSIHIFPIQHGAIIKHKGCFLLTPMLSYSINLPILRFFGRGLKGEI